MKKIDFKDTHKHILEEWKTIALKFFKHNFKQRQFWDLTKEKWRKRKGKPKHPPLEDTGNMYRNIQGRIMGNKAVNIYNNVPYSGYHNYGTEKIPQRQFIGNSDELDTRIRKMTNKQVFNFFSKAAKQIEKDMNKKGR